jgi:hypothetical protein
VSASREFFTIERTNAEFEHKIRQAIFFGRAWRECPTCLDDETTRALEALAAEYPNVGFESVLATRQEFEWQLDGTHGKIRSAEIEKIAKRLGYT